MINPLKVATGGYFKRNVKAALVIAVAGYLNFGGSPNPPIPPSSGGGGGGGYASVGNYKDTGREDRLKKIQEIILKEDEEIVILMKAFIELNSV